MARTEGPHVPPTWAALAAAARTAGADAGLDAVGITTGEPFLRARAALHERTADGSRAGMEFTYRNPDRSTEPRRTLAQCQAMVVGAMSYRRHVPVAGNPPAGRIARYAHTDGYAPLREALGAVAALLKRHGWKAVVVADDNRIVDREAAWRAGIGWFGKNANLLLPDAGSWFVLGSVLTTAPLPPNAAPLADGCGSCTRCLPACPTGAISAPGVVDARRCLAWLVQAPGAFPAEHRAALGDRMYGCDDCQDVCPPNRLLDRRGVPPPAAPGARAWVDLLDTLAADDATLLERHGRWYLPERSPMVIRRNALLALANTACNSADIALREPTLAVLTAYAHGAHADPAAPDLLAEHARWGLARIAAGTTTIAVGAASPHGVAPAAFPGPR